MKGGGKKEMWGKKKKPGTERTTKNGSNTLQSEKRITSHSKKKRS